MGDDPARKSVVELQAEFGAVKRANDDDLRLLVSCWSAYAHRWLQAASAQKATAKTTHNQQKNIEAYLVDEAFELELTNFHALVVHDVTSESALAYPRVNLERRLRAWIGMEKRVRGWWEPRSDQALACLADLQLVVPGVWIGSAVTLQHADAIARKKITHVLHCVPVVAEVKKKTQPSTATDALQQKQQATPIVQAATPPFPSTFAYTITLSEVPRRECIEENGLSPPGESDNTSLGYATWQEFETASKFLLGIVRLQDKFTASVSSMDSDDDKDDDEPGKLVNGVSNSAEMGLLLYCDSGVSTSITVCTALLMYRFCLPLRHAMQLLRSARRFIAPSPYLQRQLELYDEELRRRRQGLQRLPLHQTPA